MLLIPHLCHSRYITDPWEILQVASLHCRIDHLLLPSVSCHLVNYLSIQSFSSSVMTTCYLYLKNFVESFLKIHLDYAFMNLSVVVTATMSGYFTNAEFYLIICLRGCKISSVIEQSIEQLKSKLCNNLMSSFRLTVIFFPSRINFFFSRILHLIERAIHSLYGFITLTVLVTSSSLNHTPGSHVGYLK